MSERSPVPAACLRLGSWQDLGTTEDVNGYSGLQVLDSNLTIVLFHLVSKVKWLVHKVLEHNRPQGDRL